MCPDSLDNEGVKVENAAHGNDVVADEDEECVALLVPGVFKIFEAATDQKSLKRKLAPNFQCWPDQHQYRISPGKQDEDQSFQ